MKKTVYATKQILDGSHKVENANYKKRGEELIFMFCHSPLLIGIRPTTWEVVESLFPPIADIKTDRDSDILLYDKDLGVWKRQGE